MPPETSAPGHRSLSSGIASMNAFAKPACSSIPVATARTFGSRTISSGAKPGLADQEVVGAAEDLDLALDGVGLALLVERHHDDRGAVARGSSRALSRKASSPSFSEIELTTPFPCRQRSPASSAGPARAVDHDRQPRDLRLGRDEVEERRHRLLGVEQVGVHVHVEQVCAAAHLLERDLDRALVVVRLDEPPEPRRAGHVRALADDDEGCPGRWSKGSSPVKRGRARRREHGAAAGRRRRARCV